MDNLEKTSYETNTAESHADAIRAFVEAYDALQKEFAKHGNELVFEREDSEPIIISLSAFADAVRTAMYFPVRISGEDSPTISIYEIGVAYKPEKSSGKYGINEQKLTDALRLRVNDVRALFVCENGILQKLCEILSEFLENELSENIHATALRFLNECRRMTAMWE
jgi:flagellar capping protein FliD